MSGIPNEDFDNEVDWPEPRPEPDEEPTDRHEGPLDNPEDGRWLRRDDPRRVEAERQRGRPFDEFFGSQGDDPHGIDPPEDDEVGYEGER